MATKRDLVEAHAFSRRRLVTAFVSGAPGGREVEPARPGRSVVGGVALGVLLLAGAAVSGVLASRTQVDWQQPNLIISKEKGQPYVITEASKSPVLHPVINITSARLILGSSVSPVIIPEKTIQEQTIGSEIGILGAPSTVPDTSDLVETGWTSCTSQRHGIRTYVARTPEVTYADDSAYVVESGGTRWLIAESGESSDPQGYRYRLPPAQGGAQDQLLRDLRLGVGNDAVQVPADWLSLWPEGGALDWKSLGIAGGDYGKPVSYAQQIGVPGAKVGDVVRLPQEDVLLSPKGPVELTEFAQAVYFASDPPRPIQRPRSLQTIGTSFASPTYTDADWPSSTLEPVQGEVCGVLQASAGAPPAVRLGVEPGPDASSAKVKAGLKDAAVEPAGGAYVGSASFADSSGGLPFLVDLKGISHELDGNAAEQLGYGSFDRPVVPDSWVKLFRTGAVLSESSALCQPVRNPGQACS